MMAPLSLRRSARFVAQRRRHDQATLPEVGAPLSPFPLAPWVGGSFFVGTLQLFSPKSCRQPYGAFVQLAQDVANVFNLFHFETPLSSLESVSLLQIETPSNSAYMDERVRRYQTLFLERLMSVGQQSVAKAIGVSEPTVTRLKADHLEHFCAVCAAIGVKLVPQEMACYRKESIASILQLAKERLEQIEGPEELEFPE